MTVEEWAERYGRAWEDADEDAVAALFTEDAEYRSSPFREPFRGAAEIRASGAVARARRATFASAWAGPSPTATAPPWNGGQR